MSYLMYAGKVIAVSDDPNALLALKAEYVFKGSVLYPSMLSITFDGKSWVFDREFDKKSALRYLAGER